MKTTTIPVDHEAIFKLNHVTKMIEAYKNLSEVSKTIEIFQRIFIKTISAAKIIKKNFLKEPPLEMLNNNKVMQAAAKTIKDCLDLKKMELMVKPAKISTGTPLYQEWTDSSCTSKKWVYSWGPLVVKEEVKKVTFGKLDLTWKAYEIKTYPKKIQKFILKQIKEENPELSKALKKGVSKVFKDFK